MPPWAPPFLICSLAVLLAAFFTRWVLAASPRPGDVLTGFIVRGIRLYARLLHHMRIVGAEHIPPTMTPGPLIVVANHTAGVDPILIQAACPFEIRWLMAEDMRVAWMDRVWNWARVIFVDRSHKGGAAGLRTAIAHLREGGVIGLFPEGRLERPPRHLYPFLPGVGVLIARTGAPVLPIVVDDAPHAEPAWASLWTPSSSIVRAMPPIHYAPSSTPRHIVDDLRRRYQQWTGWPDGAPEPGSHDEPLLPSEPRALAGARGYLLRRRAGDGSPRPTK